MSDWKEIRASGVLLPVSALPSPYGIGTFGREAYSFVNFLSEAGQSYWQILPLGITSYGDSPYQSPSAFAGGYYYIDLDLLVEEGFLLTEDLEGIDLKGKSRSYFNCFTTSLFSINPVCVQVSFLFL